MRVYIKKRNSDVSAIGEYNFESGEMIVKKGAIVSERVATDGKFRSASSVLKYREAYCKGRKTQEDIAFKSASTAANFVTGTSTNGLIAWKDDEGNTLKSLITEQ